MTKRFSPNISKPFSRRILLGVAAGLPLAYVAKNAMASDGRPTKYALLNKPVPKFSAPLRGGGTFSNANLKGKTTVIDVFGLWCPDCMADADNVAEFAKLARTKNIQFIGLHTRGRYGRWGSLDNFFKEKGYSYPVAIDDDSAIFKALKIEWVPSYLIVDSKGIIRDYTNDLGVSGLGAKGLLARAQKIK